MKISWPSLNATAKPKQSQNTQANFSNPLKLNHLDSDKFTPSFGTDGQKADRRARKPKIRLVDPEVIENVDQLNTQIIKKLFPKCSPAGMDKLDNIRALMVSPEYFHYAMVAVSKVRVNMLARML